MNLSSLPARRRLPWRSAETDCTCKSHSCLLEAYESSAPASLSLSSPSRDNFGVLEISTLRRRAAEEWRQAFPDIACLAVAGATVTPGAILSVKLSLGCRIPITQAFSDVL